MEKIIVEASNVWDYFQKHKTELEKAEYIIAENDDYGVNITLSSERGFPCFVVTADNYQYAEECASSKNECGETARKLYDFYLTDKILEDENLNLIDREEVISERELELDEAIITLLDVILEDNAVALMGVDVDEICEDLKENILEYLYREHNISTRRPMILEDEDTGEEFFEEYPYEHMTYGDSE